jgi:hypothetical protein
MISLINYLFSEHNNSAMGTLGIPGRFEPGNCKREQQRWKVSCCLKTEKGKFLAHFNDKEDSDDACHSYH